MIISDGTTDITINYADEVMSPELDKKTSVSSGGFLKGQTAGERLKFSVKARVTPAEYRQIIDLFNNDADEYYYTPEEDYTFYSSVTFPIRAMFTNLKREWDNRGYYYINFDVESVEYL